MAGYSFVGQLDNGPIEIDTAIMLYNTFQIISGNGIPNVKKEINQNYMPAIVSTQVQDI